VSPCQYIAIFVPWETIPRNLEGNLKRYDEIRPDWHSCGLLCGLHKFSAAHTNFLRPAQNGELAGDHAGFCVAHTKFLKVAQRPAQISVLKGENLINSEFYFRLEFILCGPHRIPTGHTNTHRIAPFARFLQFKQGKGSNLVL